MQAAQNGERGHAGSAWRETGFVFTTELGEPCDPRNAFRALRVAAKKAGLPQAGLHTLRHSAVSVMQERPEVGVRGRRAGPVVAVAVGAGAGRQPVQRESGHRLRRVVLASSRRLQAMAGPTG